MRRLLDRTLHSKVARRMALLFIGCAVVPLAGLTLLTISTTTTHLEEEAWARLHHEVKASAMGALERLSLLEGTLRVVGAAIDGAPSASTPPAVERLGETLGAATPALAYFPTHGPGRPIRGQLPLPPLDDADRRQLLAAGRLLVTLPPPSEARHVLLVRVDVPGGGGIAAAAVNHRALFELDADQLPPYSELCVVQGVRELACSAGAPSEVVRQLTSTTPDRVVETEAGAFFVSVWTIPLKASYGAEPWTAIMISPEATVLGPLRLFVRDFWLVLTISILIVALVAISQVRRQLGPVALLAQATRRMALRDFDRPVQVWTGDEFEELGRSFNALAAELKRQFADLEAFNLGTLAALARAIDAKSPWTAGHSERVTRLAVALAVEMDLPADEIADLRRGGLIHDIGKLATPAQILDKAGRLTDDERRIVEEHTRRGVHILEPIPGYERLLPIVGQHHERWDGAGYPDKLKGTAIARTARVLAVADVCDALRSDRPYRKGMAWPEVVASVQAQSGRHFDPAVVEALVRLDPRRADLAA